jgi:hypothetical protein
MNVGIEHLPFSQPRMRRVRNAARLLNASNRGMAKIASCRPWCTPDLPSRYVEGLRKAGLLEE